MVIRRRRRVFKHTAQSQRRIPFDDGGFVLVPVVLIVNLRKMVK